MGIPLSAEAPAPRRLLWPEQVDPARVLNALEAERLLRDLVKTPAEDMGHAEVEAADTDGDGIPDSEDSDDDGDGYSDSEEADFGSDPLDPDDVPTAPGISPAIMAIIGRRDSD